MILKMIRLGKGKIWTPARNLKKSTGPGERSGDFFCGLRPQYETVNAEIK